MCVRGEGGGRALRSSDGAGLRGTQEASLRGSSLSNHALGERGGRFRQSEAERASRSTQMGFAVQ